MLNFEEFQRYHFYKNGTDGWMDGLGQTTNLTRPQSYTHEWLKESKRNMSSVTFSIPHLTLSFRVCFRETHSESTLSPVVSVNNTYSISYLSKRCVSKCSLHVCMAASEPWRAEKCRLSLLSFVSLCVSV